MLQKQLTGIQLFFLTLALGLGTFIQILDVSITNVSLPQIAGDLGTSATNGVWIITSFAISNGVVLLLTGWLARRFGDVKLFVWSCISFAFVSFLCGLARNFSLLVFLRVLQGATGGTLIPMAQSLIMMYYPEEKRGLGLGLWSMIVVVAPILGPIVGGWITDNYGWPWIFYINVPFGLLAAMLTKAILREEDFGTISSHFDIVGFISLSFFVGSLQVVLDKGNELDWFDSFFIQCFSVIAFLSLAFFILWELSHKHPLLELAILKNRSFTIATVTSSIAFFIFYGGFVLVPLWLQTQMGYTAYKAGLVLSGTGLISIVLTPLVGRFLHLLDLRIWAAASFLFFALAFFWSASFTPQVTFSTIFLQRIIVGFGTSLFFVPLSALALQGFSRHNMKDASGVFNFFRMVAGGGFGASFFVTLWNRREAMYHTYLTEALSPGNYNTNEYLQSIAPLLPEKEQSLQVLQNLVNQQTFMLSINDVFWFAGVISLLIAPFIWFAKPAPTINKEAIHADAL